MKNTPSNKVINIIPEAKDRFEFRFKNIVMNPMLNRKFGIHEII